MSKSFYSGKKVLVTGGCGLIGSYLVELLIEDGAIVTVADNLSRLHVGAKVPIFDGDTSVYTLLKYDLTEYDKCLEACEGQDVVMNLAAKVTGILYNQKNQADMFCENMALQQNVIRAAAAVGVDRFLQISTACIYPHDAAVPTPESEGDRGTPEPTNLGYGWAKRMGEQLAKFYSTESKMKIAIVRPFNAYGVRDNFEEGLSHVIPALINRVLDGQDPLICWGSGNQSRAFVHARDVAMGMKLVTEKYAVADPVNVGHQEEITIRDLTQMILKISGRNTKVVFDTSKPDGYPRRSNDVSKLKKVTGGWLPEVRLEQGLKEMIAWYQEKRKQSARAAGRTESRSA